MKKNLIRLLFPHGLIGQHGDDKLQTIDSAHMGVLFSQAQDPALCFSGGEPFRKAFPVRVSGSREVCQISAHLAAQVPVLFSHGAPAVFQRPEPVPQIAAVPGAVIISGKLAVKEPGIAGLVPLL